MKLKVNNKSLHTLVSTGVITDIDYIDNENCLCLIELNKSKSFYENNLSKLISDIKTKNINVINNITFINGNFYDEISYNE